MKIVYSRDGCAGCVRLIEEYKSNGMVEDQDYQVIKLDKDISTNAFVIMYPHVKSLPFVVENPKY